MPPSLKKILEDYAPQETAALVVDAVSETMLGSVAGQGIKLVSTVARKVQERKADRMYKEVLDSWARAANAPKAEFESVLWDRGLDDEAVQDRLYETFKHMAAARVPEAYPYIAMLTAPYALEQKEPDDFFRWCASLLEQCDAADVELLRGVFEKCRRGLDRATVGFCLQHRGNEIEVSYQESMSFNAGGFYMDRVEHITSDPIKRLLKLLRDSRLVVAGGDGTTCYIQKDIAERMARVFATGTTP